LIIQERQTNRVALEASANISPNFEKEEDLRSPGESSWWDSLLAVRIRFYGSRVFLAVIFGVLTTSVSDFASPQPHNAIIVIAGLVLIASGFFFVLRLSEKGVYRSVVAVFVHLILMAILFSSFYSNDASGYIRVFAAICHTTWFSLTYFQAPTYRRIMRMNPTTFAYSDRLCSFIVLEAVMWTVMLLKGSFESTVSQMQIIAPVQWCTVAVLMIATFIMTRHFMSYYPEDTVYGRREDFSPQIEEKSKENVIQTISEKYYLTKRETEVFELLALGYSRPYIQKRLFISEGTVKTHSRSIYSKLKVNNRDELLKLVDTGNWKRQQP
jgi:DNA-binding CsgD family transcriptional regulator